MRSECVAADEAISEWARTGAELPDETRRHVEQCDECARVLRRAESFSRLLLSTDSVPASPDCRSRVMERIAARRRTPVVWRYAWAVLSLGIVTAGAVVLLSTRTPDKPIAAPPAEHRHVPTANLTPAPADDHKHETPARSGGVAEVRERRRPAATGHFHHGGVVATATTDVTGRPEGPEPPPKRLPGADASANEVARADAGLVQKSSDQDGDAYPVAIVYARWDQPADDTMTYSMEDIETGRVTTCVVTRNDGVVDIDMTSSTESSDTENGGDINETKSGI